jgi:hypothetical protein
MNSPVSKADLISALTLDNEGRHRDTWRSIHRNHCCTSGLRASVSIRTRAAGLRSLPATSHHAGCRAHHANGLHRGPTPHSSSSFSMAAYDETGVGWRRSLDRSDAVRAQPTAVRGDSRIALVTRATLDGKQPTRLMLVYARAPTVEIARAALPTVVGYSRHWLNGSNNDRAQSHRRRSGRDDRNRNFSRGTRRSTRSRHTDRSGFVSHCLLTQWVWRISAGAHAGSTC